MKLPGPPLPQLHLKPGELFVTQEPQWVLTLLGSCVAITMFNPRFNLAAICHAMLPRPRLEAGISEEADRFRYLSFAIPEMSARFLRLGLSPEEVEVKMFGGGNVIHLGGEPQSDRWIGSANITLARHLLNNAKFKIKAQNVGGTLGCKIVFNTHTGEVLHKKLSQTNSRMNK